MNKNETHRGFKVKSTTNIEEIGVRVLDIEHEKSGARVVHIENLTDKENLFAITFKTYPDSSSGVAHVLEHVVLCGSKKFPVKDPFFAMIKRSSSTFMNAFTSKTWTAYPASSLIEKDFYNLFDVYIDAAFHPLIEKTSFKQEGHRREFEDAHDPSSDLLIKGIVFNEMKGAYSSPGSFFWRLMMADLFPNHTYGFDSGGDPEEITNLTHQQLLDFHADFYDPSRAIYCFYGDIPIKQHLDFLGEKLLDEAEKKEAIPPVKLVNRFTKPVSREATYPISEEDLSRKCFIGFSFLTTNIKDADETLALTLLDSILMDTDASLLKLKLIKSGLCINVESAFDTEAREMPFSFIFRGCEKADADAIEKLLFTSLREIAETKIPMNLIETALHQLEFSRSEINGDYGPYALELFGRTILPALQGGSLTEGLHIHSIFERLHNLVKDDKYLPSLIKKYFLDNNHRSRRTMAPDSELGERKHKEEEENLKKLKESLSKDDIAEILQNADEMKAYRETKEQEDLSCLPSLKLEDLPDHVSYFALDKSSYENLAVYHHEAFTNKITYATLVFDLPQIEEIDLSYLRLFASVITEVGAGGRNYMDNLNYIQEHTGGVWTSLSLNVQRENIQTCYPTISICAKALTRKNKEMFSILTDIILNPDLKDRERIRELISQIYTNLQNQLSSSAISYALKQSASSFSPWNHINNIWHGLPYYKFIEDLYNNLDTKLDTIIEKFTQLAKTIFHLNNPHLILTSDKEDWEEIVKNKFYRIELLAEASTSFTPWVDLATPRPGKHSAKTITTQVAHNAQSVCTITMQSPQAAALKIASYLFENLYIHRDVRERGGAYSCGVRLNILTGCWQFYSSKDPNIVSTYNAFTNAVDAVANGEFTEQDLLEAKLSYIQDVDTVVMPGSKGVVTYFQLKVGLTLEIRQQFRDQLLSVTKKDVMAAVKERLKPVMLDQSIRVTFSNKELINKEMPQFEKYKLATLHVEAF